MTVSCRFFKCCPTFAAPLRVFEGQESPTLRSVYGSQDSHQKGSCILCPRGKSIPLCTDADHQDDWRASSGWKISPAFSQFSSQNAAWRCPSMPGHWQLFPPALWQPQSRTLHPDFWSIISPESILGSSPGCCFSQTCSRDQDSEQREVWLLMWHQVTTWPPQLGTGFFFLTYSARGMVISLSSSVHSSLSAATAQINLWASQLTITSSSSRLCHETEPGTRDQFFTGVRSHRCLTQGTSLVWNNSQGAQQGWWRSPLKTD